MFALRVEILPHVRSADLHGLNSPEDRRNRSALLSMPSAVLLVPAGHPELTADGISGPDRASEGVTRPGDSFRRATVVGPAGLEA